MLKTYSSRINYKASLRFGKVQEAAPAAASAFTWFETDTKLLLSGGGGPTSAKNLTQKITYGTETAASVGATLQTSRGYGGAAGNQFNGYVMGGGGTAAATTDRTRYVNDTCTANISNLPRNVIHSGASGNSTEGYHCGGNTTTPSTAIEKITYGTETISTTTSTLTVARQTLECGSSQNNLYIGSGNEDTQIIEKMPWATGTVASLGNSGTQRTHYGSISSELATYWCFGINGSGTPLLTVSKTTHATDTFSNTSISETARYFCRGSACQTFGVMCGGTANSSTGQTYGTKILFSTDAASSPAGMVLPTAVWGALAAG